MDADDVWGRVDQITQSYVDGIRRELQERWAAWRIDLSRREVHEVIGGLLARQVTLATQLARNPGIWNGHLAPLILRSMVENCIMVGWILNDPVPRCRDFVLYGLGQAKLQLEHHKARLKAEGKDSEMDPIVQALETWINGQRFTFLTEVNVGNWAGVDLRDMADEAGLIDLYRFAYAPYSSAAHSMWNHISRYNLLLCQNPLHRFHSVPIDSEQAADPHYLYLAAKYAARAFDLFDRKTGMQTVVPSALEVLDKELRDFSSKVAD